MLLRAALLALSAECAFAARGVAQASPDAPLTRAQQDSALASLCKAQGFCENVTRQVQRFFRPSADTAGARGEVCFRIRNDGSVTDIATQRVSGGGAAFRLAMMRAVQDAGTRRAFGPLPSAFDPARWRWCVELAPRS